VFSVSEEALLAKGDDGKANYEIILGDSEIVHAFSTKYSNYGFEIKNNGLIEAFHAAEFAAKEKTHFCLLRAAFGIKKKEEPKKPEETKETKKAEEKVEEKKDEAKPEEPKHEEPKHEEPKHEEPKNDEAPKEGDQA
jgi:hypothetical protein